MKKLLSSILATTILFCSIGTLSVFADMRKPDLVCTNPLTAPLEKLCQKLNATENELLNTKTQLEATKKELNDIKSKSIAAKVDIEPSMISMGIFSFILVSVLFAIFENN